MVSIIIEQFSPEQHRKYLFLNFQMDPTYRAYTTHVPSYLQGRPRNVILHCLARDEKARKTLSPSDVTGTDIENGVFLVIGKSGTTHTVNFGRQTGKPSCTCKDWIRNNFPCKHFFLVFITKGEWGWNSLPQTYLESPYLTRDDDSSQIPAENNLQQHPENTIDSFPDHDNLQEFDDKLPSKVPNNFVCVYCKSYTGNVHTYTHTHVGTIN